MSEQFVSVADLLESDPSGRSLKSIQDEVLNMEFSIKKIMDAGLTPDEMVSAKSTYEAVLAAGRALEKMYA